MSDSELQTAVADLNQLPLSAFKPLFAGLKSAPLTAVRGTYKSAVVGPGWLRRSAGPGLALGGLGGWWGKRFDGMGGGVNLVQRDGAIKPVLPIRVDTRVSGIDLLPTLAVLYPPSSPFPWPRVVDELRIFAEDLLLGMTYANVNGLKRIALPFLLHLQLDPSGSGR